VLDAATMTVDRYEDLIVWQLARELEKRVFAFTATGRVTRDFDYVQQIRKSASSPPDNIAEGFGRFWPAEFAHKLRIARGELHETHRQIAKGLKESYLDADEARQLTILANRAIGAATRFLRYLDTHGEAWKKAFLKRLREEATRPGSNDASTTTRARTKNREP
jgi:four helix bundle protein